MTVIPIFDILAQQGHLRYGGFVIRFFLCGPAGWIDDSGLTCAEFIKNWAIDLIGGAAVEPSDKLSATWGEIKYSR